MNASVDGSDSTGLDAPAFERQLAHALSSPLGGLMLQADLTAKYLRHDKIAQARGSVEKLVRDFEAFGEQFRSVFMALSDVAASGGEAGDPRTCLAAVLNEAGNESLRLAYEGTSPGLALPEQSLHALLRRLATFAMSSDIEGATLRVATSADDGLLSLEGTGGTMPAGAMRPLESAAAMDLFVLREIVSRHGGRLAIDTNPGPILRIVLPLASR